MENIKVKIRYILYARKSSESEDRQVQSIPDQVTKLKELAARLDLQIVDIFTEARSARIPGARSIFNEMMKKIENGVASGILVWQINRLARNPMESGKIQQLLQDGVIKSIRTIEKEFTPEESSLYLSVEGAMSTQYSRDLSRNVKRGLQSKVEKGWIPHRANIGYLNDPATHTIVKDPERFYILRKIWELRLNGKSISDILRAANKDFCLKTKTGAKLSRNELYSILTNTFYMGCFNYNGITYKGAHEPMVTEQEFYIVQKSFKKVKRNPKKYTFAYTQLIRCAECGCFVTAETKKKKIKSTGETKHYIYYHCTFMKPGHRCSQRKYISETEFEEQIIKVLSSYEIMPELKEFIFKLLDEDSQSEKESFELMKKSRGKAIADINNRLGKLLDLKLNDLITDIEYKNKKQNLENERDDLTLSLLDKQVDKNGFEPTKKVFDFLTNIKTTFELANTEQKRAILDAFAKKITLKDAKLNIEPFEWFEKIKMNNVGMDIKSLTFEPEEISKTRTKIAENGSLSEICSGWLSIVVRIKKSPRME
ncbi:MAG: recombinase family protein [Actinobacteria bacterium]|nr:recombinase family protein [Actinomycetota bacterium]